jgi:hypothetical protein
MSSPSAPDNGARHVLTLDPVYLTGESDFGPVEILKGWRGRCTCGHSSAVFGLVELAQRWHDHHTKPLSGGRVPSKYGRGPGRG